MLHIEPFLVTLNCIKVSVPNFNPCYLKKKKKNTKQTAKNKQLSKQSDYVMRFLISPYRSVHSDVDVHMLENAKCGNKCLHF